MSAAKPIPEGLKDRQLYKINQNANTAEREQDEIEKQEMIKQVRFRDQTKN